jgi:hypothetical protein
MRVLSLGGGTQSCALALMSAAGDLPKVDHIVFADCTTGHRMIHANPALAYHHGWLIRTSVEDVA